MKVMNQMNPKANILAVVFCLFCVLHPTDRLEASWTFAVVGDSQGYNGGINTVILSELVDEFVDHRVDCLLFCGDLVTNEYFSRLERELIGWRRLMTPVYKAGIQVYPCRGNHEDWGSVEAWQSIFHDLPANGPPGEKHMTYAVRHKNALFIALDQFVNIHRVNQHWLDAQLARNDAPFVFVYGHEPAFQLYHWDCLDDYPAQRDRFWRSIQRAGGRTYFCGHDHFFHHTQLDDGDGQPDNDVHQYVIGTGGAHFYYFMLPYLGDNGPYIPILQHYERKFGYLLVEVNDLRVDLTRMNRRTNDILTRGIYEPNETWGYAAQPLILRSPNGGESVLPGSEMNITWKTVEGVGVENVRIEYSMNHGRHWDVINVVPNTGAYGWQAPSLLSNQCLIRISDVNNAQLRDVSYMPFAVSYPGDFELDVDVDFHDFAIMANHWKTPRGRPSHQPEPIDSKKFDFLHPLFSYRDLAVLSRKWLVEH